MGMQRVEVGWFSHPLFALIFLTSREKGYLQKKVEKRSEQRYG